MKAEKRAPLEFSLPLDATVLVSLDYYSYFNREREGEGVHALSLFPVRLRVLPYWTFLWSSWPSPVPFELIQLTALKFLAWKVFFLTLLCSGARKGWTPFYPSKSIQHVNYGDPSPCHPYPGCISKTQLCTERAHSLPQLVFNQPSSLS